MTGPGAVPPALIARWVQALPRALLPAAAAVPWTAGFLNHANSCIVTNDRPASSDSERNERVAEASSSHSTGVTAAALRHGAALRLGFGTAARKGWAMPAADGFPRLNRGFAASAPPLAAAAAAAEPAAPSGQPTGASGTSGSGSSPSPSSSSPEPPPQKEKEKEKQQRRLERPPNDVVYLGPLSQQHKLLKVWAGGDEGA